MQAGGSGPEPWQWWLAATAVTVITLGAIAFAVIAAAVLGWPEGAGPLIVGLGMAPVATAVWLKLLRSLGPRPSRPSTVAAWQNGRYRSREHKP